MKALLITLLFSLPISSNAKGYEFQSNACDSYQASNTLNGLIVSIVTDCKKAFRKIEKNIKIIDTEYGVSELQPSQHQIKLKLHTFKRSGIIEYNVNIIQKSLCDHTFSKCNASCTGDIKEFACTAVRETICTCG